MSFWASLVKTLPSVYVWAIWDGEARDWLKFYVNAIEPLWIQTVIMLMVMLNTVKLRWGERLESENDSWYVHWTRPGSMHSRKAANDYSIGWWMFYQLGLFMYVILFIERRQDNGRQAERSSAAHVHATAKKSAEKKIIMMKTQKLRQQARSSQDSRAFIKTILLRRSVTYLSSTNVSDCGVRCSINLSQTRSKISFMTRVVRILA